jgi:DMSO/TMAO reductase YedYZ heme-binding membrane subunit
MATTREPYSRYSPAPPTAPYTGPDTYEPDLYPDDATGAWNEEEQPADDYQPQRRATKSVDERRADRSRVDERRADRSRVDDWMDKDFKFGGSRIKRKAVALILLGAPALVPLFFMAPAFFTMNSFTFSVSVDDTLGTGAELCLFICLLVSPLILLTGQRWFFPLRRWYGILFACCGIGDMLAAGLTDSFAGGFFGRVAGHVFELMGFIMVMLAIPLLITGNHWAQRKLGRYWKPLQRTTYVIWGLLFCHLALLEGFGFENGNTNNGSGFPGDGDPIFHQRLYQYSACTLFLLTLRLPPVKRWIAARQQEGRNWLVWVTIAPIFALFIFGMIFIINEEIFKGFNSFVEHGSAE